MTAGLPHNEHFRSSKQMSPAFLESCLHLHLLTLLSLLQSAHPHASYVILHMSQRQLPEGERTAKGGVCGELTENRDDGTVGSGAEEAEGVDQPCEPSAGRPSLRTPIPLEGEAGRVSIDRRGSLEAREGRIGALWCFLAHRTWINYKVKRKLDKFKGGVWGLKRA
jgi:hypothetical protein